jgi:branched-chain amino acid transport system permease protein
MSNAATPLAPVLASPPRGRRLWIVLAALVIAILPLALQDSYWRTNLTLCGLNVLIALGLDFILGYAGQVNLGHSAIYGLGA